MPGQRAQYLKVKSKGDKAQFRIIKNPVYVGKHFQQNGDKWEITLCPRINSGEECEECELYFAAISESKKIKDSDPKKSSELEGEARKHQNSTTFYWAVLNRDSGKFDILQTTMGVRNQIDNLFATGVDVFKKDLILRNTGSPSPRDRYTITAVDSADTKELSADELAEFQKGVNFDMSSISEAVSAPEGEE